jgi:hypothetical protein
MLDNPWELFGLVVLIALLCGVVVIAERER